jgi:dUTP pyrophosphatase
MPDIVVMLKKATAGLLTPAYQTLGSAGCDIHAAESGFLVPTGRKLFATGLSLEIPDGYECQIRPRSSLALKHGIIVFNSPSTIDSDFRGELYILLLNAGSKTYEVQKGDRIAQLVFAPVTRAWFEVVNELNRSQRGEGGWGSTGR